MESMCTIIFNIVNMRRPFESYLWFDHKNNQSHQNTMLNTISEKERLAKATKDGTKRPATKKRSKPTTGRDKQGHKQIPSAW